MTKMPFVKLMPNVFKQNLQDYYWFCADGSHLVNLFRKEPNMLKNFKMFQS